MRHNIPLIPAELMGWYFNLLVPKKDANLFYKVRMGPMPSAGYGTQLREKEPANKMFKEMKIPLRMDWRLINEFKNLKDFKKYLAKVERRNVDIVACFSYGKLYNTAYLGGHTTVVDKIYISKNKIRLIDPDQDVAKWNTVSIPKLYRAMIFHGSKNHAGFWEFSYQKRK
ncbi:MAG: hypothetical protein HYW00_00700 [Candidatus Colwellbacteria bacterium]|nr:hypothetical protein [Candidatus Colwellbacteria bacterium]